MRRKLDQWSGLCDIPNHEIRRGAVDSAGDRSVNSVWHHGTPDERAAAIVRGFEVAYRERRTIAEAVQIGVNYVSVL